MSALTPPRRVVRTRANESEFFVSDDRASEAEEQQQNQTSKAEQTVMPEGRKKVLLTAFGPFGLHETNPSKEVDLVLCQVSLLRKKSRATL